MRAKLSLLTVVTLIVLVPGARTPAASGGSHGRDFELISVSNAGRQGNNDSDRATISADGRFVVFTSRSSNLVRRDTNQAADVFRRDLEDGKTERLAADDISDDQPFGFVLDTHRGHGR